MTYILVFVASTITYLLYKLTLSDQTKVTLQQTFGLSDLVSRYLDGPLLRGGEGGVEKKFDFPPEPETTLGGPVCTHIALSEFLFKRNLPVRPTFYFADKQKQGLITNNTNSVLQMSACLKRS